MLGALSHVGLPALIGGSDSASAHGQAAPVTK